MSGHWTIFVFVILEFCIFFSFLHSPNRFHDCSQTWPTMASKCHPVFVAKSRELTPAKPSGKNSILFCTILRKKKLRCHSILYFHKKTIVRTKSVILFCDFIRKLSSLTRSVILFCDFIRRLFSERGEPEQSCKLETLLQKFHPLWREKQVEQKNIFSFGK